MMTGHVPGMRFRTEPGFRTMKSLSARTFQYPHTSRWLVKLEKLSGRPLASKGRIS